MTSPQEEEPTKLRRVFRRLPKPRRATPGARPGTFVVDPDAPKPQIHVIEFGSDHVEEHDIEQIEQIADMVGRQSVTWINVDGLGDAGILSEIGEAFGFHRLMLEDIVHVHQRAKVEQYDEHVFLVARMVSLEDSLATEQISLVLGKDYVISFQERRGDCLDQVRKRLRSSAGRLRHAGADFLAYALLDAIIDGYFPVLEQYGERLEHIEDGLLEEATNETANQIHQLRAELYVLRKAIWPHRELVNSMIRDPLECVTDETRMHLRDCYDHTIQLVEITETCREMCADLRDLHFSQISIRQNEIMKVLTITATIFIPLSFVAGLYGMNFDPKASPLNMPELSWFYGYPFALGLMAAVAIGMLLFFRYRGWLGRDS